MTTEEKQHIAEQYTADHEALRRIVTDYKKEHPRCDFNRVTVNNLVRWSLFRNQND